MKIFDKLHKADPLRAIDIQALAADPEFDDLLAEIMSAQPVERSVDETVSIGVIDNVTNLLGRRPEQIRARRKFIFVAAALVVLLAASLPIVLGGGGLTGPVTTPYRAARALPLDKHVTSPRGSSESWQLVADVVSSSWQQNSAGPPPGALTCPSITACYAISGQYGSPNVNAPLVSESLYVSSDFGIGWSILPMPSDFSATTPLSCADTENCSAGGTFNDQSVLITTTNGGHQWTMNPLNGLSGELFDLACSSATNCHGIVGPAWVSARDQPTLIHAIQRGENPSESFVSTSDGGATWSSSPLADTSLVTDFSCADATHCVVVGVQSFSAALATPDGYFVHSTSDGGNSWTTGSLPAGFDPAPFSDGSRLSCSDASHCMIIGSIQVPMPNPPQCKEIPQAPRLSSTTTNLAPTTTTVPSPEVQAAAGPEGIVATRTNDESLATTGGGSCDGRALVSDIAATSNGGLTWTPEVLPADVPIPSLTNITCPSATVCWASGSEAVKQVVGGTTDGGSSVLLGTADGGLTWSKVTFTVPANAPNDYGQSYISIGKISCPRVNSCIAFGDAAQGAKSTAVYRFVSPESS